MREFATPALAGGTWESASLGQKHSERTHSNETNDVNVALNL